MPTITPTLPSDGQNADASDITTPINEILAVLNGHIDGDNIEPGSLPWSSMDVDGDIPADAMEDSGNLETHRDESLFDHVVSGGVWTGDSYGSTRNASMTAMTAVVSGKRVTVNAVTARAFTASKDTYVYVSNTGNLTYTEVTNNAASPSLPANNMLIAIIVTGASNIANAGSINQGQEDKVLPIASSIPYTVTDSLGNLICNRNPNQTVLGLRRRTSDFSTTSTSATQVTELSIPVVVPSNRKIRLHIFARQARHSDAGEYVVIAPFIGTVGSGTALPEFINDSSSAATADGASYSSAPFTPSSSSITINIGVYAATAGTVTLQATASTPIVAWVELL